MVAAEVICTEVMAHLLEKTNHINKKPTMAAQSALCA